MCSRVCTDPPKVILLTVDGREVNGHLITEGQQVSISCSFEKGNPPASFYLLDNNSQRLNTTAAENYLNYTFSAQCSSAWSTVRCEGNGSEQNKSVSFAVACEYVLLIAVLSSFCSSFLVLTLFTTTSV